MGPAAARRELDRRLAARDSDWLRLVQRAVYGHPTGTTARLLRHAGCEMGDLERLVRTAGLEGTLAALFRAGVYLTASELRGAQPVIRGHLVLEAGLDAVRNPLATPDLPIRSGGSSGAARAVGWDLEFVRDRAVDLVLAEAARGGPPARGAVWAVPGTGALVHLLDLVARGAPADRWFSPVDPSAVDLPARYRWASRLVRWAARFGGAQVPEPEHVPIDAPGPVLEWLRHGRPAERTLLHARPSAALRICEEALRAGIDLTGVDLVVGGEPVTAARAATMRRAGARVLPRYAAVEVGLIGDACLTPGAPDDVHVLHDLVAVIQPGAVASATPLPPDALLVTSLRPTAPLVLLNASTGDVATLEPATCGCPVAAVGWATRLRGIRSFEKLTAQGMTFLDADVIRVLEEVLPRRFGGGAGDYQLIEEEDAGGRARLRFLVAPAVGPIDEAAVSEALVAALGEASAAARLMADVWRQTRVLAVERRRPVQTAAGKILHLHRGPGA